MTFNQPAKIDVKCPECGAKNEILWFRKDFRVERITGTTGSSGKAFFSRKGEKVEGNCISCGHKFKTKDLD